MTISSSPLFLCFLHYTLGVSVPGDKIDENEAQVTLDRNEENGKQSNNMQDSLCTLYLDDILGAILSLIKQKDFSCYDHRHFQFELMRLAHFASKKTFPIFLKPC